MLSEQARAALETLRADLAEHPEHGDALRHHWRFGWRAGHAAAAGDLPTDARAAATTLGHELSAMDFSGGDITSLADLFGEAGGDVLFAWCAAHVWRRDTKMAPLLAAIANQTARWDQITPIARERVVEGPM